MNKTRKRRAESKSQNRRAIILLAVMLVLTAITLSALAFSQSMLIGHEESRLAGETIQALGGNGYINDYPAGRLWRDAKLYEIGAGTSEIRRMLIGRELFSETR